METTEMKAEVPAMRTAPSLSLRGLQAQLKQAEIFIESGLLPEYIKKPATVVAIVQRGTELGIPPMEALNTLYPVHGKISCDGKTMLALAWRSGKLAAFTVLENTDDICRIQAQRIGCEPQEFSYTIEEAERLGLTKATQAHPGKGAQYRSQPGIMLLWKATARILRVLVPDALAGMYTHDEMNLPVREEDGNLILDAKAVAQIERHDEVRDAIGAVFDAGANPPMAADGSSRTAEAVGGGAGSQSAENGLPAEAGTQQAPSVGEPCTPPTRSAEPVCPKCSGPLWDNRAKRAEDEAAIAAGTRTKKPRAAWSCRDKACGGTIWPAVPETPEQKLGLAEPPKPNAPITLAQVAELKALRKAAGLTKQAWLGLLAAYEVPGGMDLTSEQATNLSERIKKAKP